MKGKMLRERLLKASMGEDTYTEESIPRDVQ